MISLSTLQYAILCCSENSDSTECSLHKGRPLYLNPGTLNPRSLSTNMSASAVGSPPDRPVLLTPPCRPSPWVASPSRDRGSLRPNARRRTACHSATDSALLRSYAARQAHSALGATATTVEPVRGRLVGGGGGEPEPCVPPLRTKLLRTHTHTRQNTIPRPLAKILSRSCSPKYYPVRTHTPGPSRHPQAGEPDLLYTHTHLK